MGKYCQKMHQNAKIGPEVPQKEPCIRIVKKMPRKLHEYEGIPQKVWQAHSARSHISEKLVRNIQYMHIYHILYTSKSIEDHFLFSFHDTGNVMGILSPIFIYHLVI